MGKSKSKNKKKQAAQKRKEQEAAQSVEFVEEQNNNKNHMQDEEQEGGTDTKEDNNLPKNEDNNLIVDTGVQSEESDIRHENNDKSQRNDINEKSEKSFPTNAKEQDKVNKNSSHNEYPKELDLDSKEKFNENGDNHITNLERVAEPQTSLNKAIQQINFADEDNQVLGTQTSDNNVESNTKKNIIEQRDSNNQDSILEDGINNGNTDDIDNETKISSEEDSESKQYNLINSDQQEISSAQNMKHLFNKVTKKDEQSTKVREAQNKCESKVDKNKSNESVKNNNGENIADNSGDESRIVNKECKVNGSNDNDKNAKNNNDNNKKDNADDIEDENNDNEDNIGLAHRNDLGKSKDLEKEGSIQKKNKPPEQDTSYTCTKIPSGEPSNKKYPSQQESEISKSNVPATSFKVDSKEQYSEPIILEGPFSLENLIDNIALWNPEILESGNSEITCVSAYEENIYVGTQHGEVLHYYKLDSESGYILISRQRAHASKIKPIRKILLLPQVGKALILNGTMINVFLLPELSPANMGKIKDVNDMAIDVDNFNPANEATEIPVVLFTKKMIRIIGVTNESLKLVKDISYPNTIKGLRRDKFSLVATKTNYDLIDIDSFLKIPLLPVSSLPENDIDPFILPISKDEYLITCGTRLQDPAMGMIVNHNGDISRGTIPWSVYPDSIQVHYPYTLAVLHSDNKYTASVHSINDQCEVQKIEFVNKVKLTSVTKVFEEPHEPLMNVIVKVPLFENKGLKVADRQAQENKSMQDLCKIKSSLLLYYPNKGKIKILKAVPTLGRLSFITESLNIEKLQKEYDDFVGSSLPAKTLNQEEKIVFSFLRNALGLMFIINENFGDAYKIWTNQYDSLTLQFLMNAINEPAELSNMDEKTTLINDLKVRLNPKLILYFFASVLDAELEGLSHINKTMFSQYYSFDDVWVYKGLKKLVTTISDKKSKDVTQFYIKLLINWLSKFEKFLGLFSVSTTSDGIFDDGISPTAKSVTNLRDLSSKSRKDDLLYSSQDQKALYKNNKASSSDSHLQTANRQLSQIPETSKNGTNGHTFIGKQLSEDLLQTFKTIEIILLEHFVIDSSKRNTDRQLVLYINNYVKLTVHETIKILSDSHKYGALLQAYEFWGKHKECLELWMALIKGKLVDEAFNVNDKEFVNAQVERMTGKVLNCDNIQEKYSMKSSEFLKYLINVGQENVVITTIFGNAHFDNIEVLKLIGDLRNEQVQKTNYTSVDDLRIKYLEHLVVENNQFVGILMLQYAKYLIELTKKSNIESFIQQVINDYKKLIDFPKVSILNYFKIQIKLLDKKQAFRDEIYSFHAYNTRLLKYVNSINELAPNTFVMVGNDYKVTYESNIEVFERLYMLLSPLDSVFLVDLIVIESSLGQIDKVTDRLAHLTDFSTLETYIITKGQTLFNQHIKPLITKEHDKDGDMKDLVLQLYKSYLANHTENHKLIENFIIRYNQYIDLPFLLNSVPNGTSLRFVSDTVLIKNMVLLNNEYSLVVMKKNLARSELNHYTELLKKLKHSQIPEL